MSHEGWWSNEDEFPPARSPVWQHPFSQVERERKLVPTMIANGQTTWRGRIIGWGEPWLGNAHPALLVYLLVIVLISLGALLQLALSLLTHGRAWL